MKIRSRILSGALAALLVLTFQGAAVAQDSAVSAERAVWPQWRGPASDGTAAETGVFPDGFGLRVRWRRELGSGYSGVVVAEGHAVTMFSDGRQDYLVALDADDGAEAWRLALGPTFPGREGAVDGPVSTPLIHDGVVFALGPRGDLVAVTLAGGSIVWRHDLVRDLGAPVPHWGFGTSPTVANGLLIVATGGKDGRVVTAFDSRTGSTAWSAGQGMGSVRYPSPMVTGIGDRPQVIAASSTNLLGIDPATGLVLWHHEHGGQGFYGGMINPLAVGGNRLFLNLRPNESEMLRIAPQGDGFAVQSAWTTPHLRRNYATPVAHDGHVYGFDGDYLSCVEDDSGRLAWQSRPPGNGWPILVDGHLVTLTKRGSLHVARASPDGYHERASLQAFNRLVWTPPSFAYGRIYGRDSFSQVAAFEVTSSGRKPQSAATPEEATARSDFARWVAEVRTAPDRAERVRQFLEEHPRSPIVEGERFVHIVWQGQATDLAVRGDMLNVRQDQPMQRLGPEDAADALFYASFELEPDARVSYQLVRNLTEVLTDPRNPQTSQSLALFGPVSRIVMPRAETAAAHDAQPAPASAGRIESLELKTEPVIVGSKTWGGARKLRVYLPAGYETSQRRYPTVFVQYGLHFLEVTSFDKRLDQAIGRSLQPLIVVFVESTSPYEYARSQRGVHGRMLAEQLVPEIDARFRTLAAAEHRVLVGADEAGYSALATALRYPHVFGNAIAQSVLPIGAGGRQLLDAIELVPQEPVRIHLDWGRYDPVDPRNGTDVPAFNRQLRDTLLTNGYEVEHREWNDGPDWGLLADRLRRALEAWFPADG